MGTTEIFGLYALAFVIFAYAWRDARLKIREAVSQQNHRAADIARGDRNFAIFAGLYIALIIFATSKFHPGSITLPTGPPEPATPSKAGNTVKARALILEDGKVLIEGADGKLIKPGKRRVRIEFSP